MFFFFRHCVCVSCVIEFNFFSFPPSYPIYFADTIVQDKIIDTERIDYLKNYIAQVRRAKNEGVKVAGYFVWTLLDNFEWAYGWWPQFGLVHVDRQNGFKRTVRPSAKWWAEWIAKYGK